MTETTKLRKALIVDFIAYVSRRIQKMKKHGVMHVKKKLKKIVFIGVLLPKTITLSWLLNQSEFQVPGTVVTRGVVFFVLSV